MEKSIGLRIRNRRIELGLSVDELAAKLGKNRATIYRYESNEIENMPLDIIMPLAEALNTTPAYIMGWENLEKVANEKVEEERLLKLYNSLNEEGKEKAFEFMEMLDASGKYKKHDQNRMVEEEA